MKLSKFKPTIAAILFAVFGVAAILWWQHSIWTETQMKNYEESHEAYVILAKGNSKMTVNVRIQDMSGRPVVGAKINVINNSGWNPGMSDQDGFASIHVGEYDVAELLVDGNVVLDRPRAYDLGYPNAIDGLYVLVILKSNIKIP